MGILLVASLFCRPRALVPSPYRTGPRACMVKKPFASAYGHWNRKSWRDTVLDMGRNI